MPENEEVNILKNEKRILSPEEKKLVRDHRQRVYKRFDATMLDGFSDHEILEFLLFYVFEQKDTKVLAKKLLAEFNSLEKVFAAGKEQLCSIEGIGPASARLLHFIREISFLLGRRRAFKEEAVISAASSLITYLGTSMENLPEEQLRVLFVNNSNKIIKDEVLSEGVEDQTAVYPRKIMKRAMALHATGIIVVHNHPTGQLRPSNADLVITRAIAAAADTLDLRFLDHIIVGKEDKGYFSFRENGLI